MYVLMIVGEQWTEAIEAWNRRINDGQWLIYRSSLRTNKTVKQLRVFSWEDLSSCLWRVVNAKH